MQSEKDLSITEFSELFVANIKESIEVKSDLLSNSELVESVRVVSNLIVDALSQGKKIILAGNGGSAADAQHIAAEFVSRLNFDRPGLSALSLATDTSILTAIGNDYGYEMLFKRQLEAQSKKGDIFLGITTSGKSRNIIAALEACDTLGVESVALCGVDGDLDRIANNIIRVPSSKTARIQECHILIGHIICQYVEQHMFGHLNP